MMDMRCILCCQSVAFKSDAKSSYRYVDDGNFTKFVCNKCYDALSINIVEHTPVNALKDDISSHKNDIDNGDDVCYTIPFYDINSYVESRNKNVF